MKLHEKKDEQQRLALNNWHRNDYCGSIIAGTGYGKSKCGVMAINHVLNNLGGTKALVLVPTIQLKDQFKEEFEKWECEDCLDKVDIVCYQSAYKFKDRKYDIVVCDEIHLGLSEKYRKFFNNNYYDKLLCLTATLPEEPMYKLYLDSLAPTIYELTLDDCVAMELVAPYEIYCMPLEHVPDGLLFVQVYQALFDVRFYHPDIGAFYFRFVTDQTPVVPLVRHCLDAFVQRAIPIFSEQGLLSEDQCARAVFSGVRGDLLLSSSHCLFIRYFGHFFMRGVKCENKTPQNL